MVLNKFIIYSLRKIKGFRDNLISVPELIDKPQGKRVLVLSPHFDDETLGCGGTLRKHVLSGDRVSIVYMTDGKQGIPQIKDKKRVESIRKEEARNAREILGIGNYFYLNEPECYKKISEKAVVRLGEIIHREQPDLIYLPWFLDNHVDHVKINKLLFLATRNYNKKLNVCAFETWTPLIPNIIVDISKTFEKKKEAAFCYKSQMKQVDYWGTIEGLNRYRTCYNLFGKGHAEAFIYLPLNEYFKLAK